MMNIIDKLLASNEPSIRFKIRVNVSGKSIDTPVIRQLREEIRCSPRVQSLLSDREEMTAPLYAY
ncbi:MAG: hypothetical protein ACYC27_20880 [Armatimonadota bacterium]